MSLWQDVHYALRRMRKSPRVSITVLLTLALGIGANTAIFSIVNATLLRPLPFSEPGQLVQLKADLRGLGAQNVGFSEPELADLRDHTGIFSGTSASWQFPGNITGTDHPERIDAMAVGTNYFSLLGVVPQAGRLFDSRDIADGFADTAIISDSLWHREFGGEASVVGRKIRLDNDLYTIVGVVPAAFRPPNPAAARPVDIWVTTGFRALPFPPPQRNVRFVPNIIARLKPGITVEQARAQLQVFAGSLRRAYGADYPANAGWTLSLVPLKEVVVGNSRTLLLSLLLAVAFVLLIACVNVANLLLANALTRQREVSIRMALGAERKRILVQMLTESAMLSLLATIVGATAAALSLRFLVATLPTQLPHVNAIRMDWRVLAFSLAAAFVTTILFGLFPALQLARTETDATELRGRSASQSARDSRLGVILVGAEVALSVMLLVGAGLLLKTFWQLLHVDPGFQTQHLVAGNVWLPVPNDPKTDVYATPDQRTALMREMLRRLESVPGLQSASISTLVPMQNPAVPTGLVADGSAEQGDAPTAVRIVVTPDFFTTLGISLVEGRLFQDSDTTKTPLVLVIDQAAAHRFFGDKDPVGRRLRSSRDVFVNGKLQPPPWMTVVGVVSNAKLSSLDEQNLPHVYNDMYQISGKLFGVLVRATGDKAALARAITTQIQSVDPNLPVSNISEMAEIVNTGVGDRRFAAWLLAIFAGVALVLTSIGIYGVTSYGVARRSKELSIRAALGAAPGDLVRMVLKNGMLPILAGLAVGAAGAIICGRLIAGLLFSVKANDAAILALAATTVVLIGMAANYLPARRAARVDPVVALRVE